MQADVLRTLAVQSLYVHAVPRHLTGSDDTDELAEGLSEAASTLDTELRNFLTERIAETLARAANEIESDPDSDSPTPGLLVELLADRAEWLATSQSLARRLYESQGGVNPPGLLLVCRACVSGAPAVVVLKLEKEQGARVRTNLNDDGKRVLSVEHIRELFLSTKTRVFKAALFRLGSEETLTGFASDTQLGKRTDVARFFLHQFLGCRLTEEPDVSTERYFRAAERFINDEVESGEQMARYLGALHADLNSQRADVDPEVFAAQNLDGEHRGPFVGAIEAALGSARRFPKDTSRISTKIRRLRMRFANDVDILAPERAIGSEVRLEELEDGRTRAEIIDHLENVDGR